jgi:hypothetical protein
VGSAVRAQGPHERRHHRRVRVEGYFFFADRLLRRGHIRARVLVPAVCLLALTRVLARSLGEAAAPTLFGYVSQYVFGGPGSAAGAGQGGGGGRPGNAAATAWARRFPCAD